MAKKTTSKAAKTKKASGVAASAKGAGKKAVARKAGSTAKKAAVKTAKSSAKTASKAKVTKKTSAKKVAKKTVRKKAPKAPKVSVKAYKIPKCPLKKKELAEFREMLLEKRRTLLGDMTGMAEEAMRSSTAMSDHSTMPVHMADIGTDNYEQEFTLGLLESERQLLREIDESLEQIASGRYGVCMGTGEPIGTPRLKAKPWAKYAISYVRKIEQGLIRVPARDYGETLAEEQDDDD